MREELLTQLYRHGLHKEEALGVLKYYENSAEGESMKGRLYDDCSTLTPELQQEMWREVKAAAVGWIDTYQPKHWARPLFAGELLASQ